MRHGHWVLQLSALAGCMLIANCGGQATDRESGPKIAVLYTEPHPVLNTIISSFEERARELMPGVEFIERHGSGDSAEYPAVVRSVILGQKVDLLAPITTPMSVEAAKQALGRTPIVFLGVTDPEGAGLVRSLDQPKWASGVSDNPPMEGVVDLVRLYYPSAKKIGIPYDPSDQPGVTTAKRAAEACKERGLTAVLRPVSSEAQLRAAVRALASRSDAVVIGMDNMMMKNAGLISSTIRAFGKPLFAADDKSVRMGALAGVGVDYSDVGRFGAEIAAEVLVDHKRVGDIPVRRLSTGAVFYNALQATELSVVIPSEVRAEGEEAGGSVR